jgi:hypothetical protein
MACALCNQSALLSYSTGSRARKQRPCTHMVAGFPLPTLVSVPLCICAAPTCCVSAQQENEALAHIGEGSNFRDLLALLTSSKAGSEAPTLIGSRFSLLPLETERQKPSLWHPVVRLAPPGTKVTSTYQRTVLHFEFLRTRAKWQPLNQCAVLPPALGAIKNSGPQAWFCSGFRLRAV